MLYYEFDGEDFEYEIDMQEGKEALIDILSKTYNIKKEKVADLVDDLDLFYFDYLKSFEDEFKDYFEEKAYEQFKDCREYSKDQLGYNGYSIKDFI